MNEMWCDCKVMKVIPPTQEEIDKDAAEEQEEESKKAKDDKESPTKNKKAKKSFSPPEHLFKYELLEVEPDNPDNNPVSISTYVIIFFCKNHIIWDSIVYLIEGRYLSRPQTPIQDKKRCVVAFRKCLN